MSVALFKYEKDTNGKLRILLSESISGEDFYIRNWVPAIKELGVVYIQDGSDFDKSKLSTAMKELELLRQWAIDHLKYNELDYMKSRVENLQQVIPKAFEEDENAILRIF